MADIPNIETGTYSYAGEVFGIADSSLRTGHYGGDMFVEVTRYAASAVRLAANECFDVVHAHDWMTFPAGRAVGTAKARPLVVHIHSTEFDRSGAHVNQRIYDIECTRLHGADHVITVSNRTRDILIDRYAVPARKISVVYNGIDRQDCSDRMEQNSNNGHKEKIVLFLGRITTQKGLHSCLI